MDSCTVIPVNLRFVYAFILKGEKTVIVDSGIPGSDKAILSALSAHGIKSGDVSLLLFTHGHADHMGSASALRGVTGAPTAIHKKDADVIRTGVNPPLYPVTLKSRIFSHFSPKTVNGFSPYEPEILIDGETSLCDFGINAKIIETPGHTLGSISVVLESGEIIVGDAIMGVKGIKGKPSFPIYAENVKKAEDSIKSILSLNPKIIYTGHGGPFTPDEVRRNLKIK